MAILGAGHAVRAGDRRRLFHAMRELLWTYLFGWQNCHGVLIVSSCVFPWGSSAGSSATIRSWSSATSRASRERE